MITTLRNEACCSAASFTTLGSERLFGKTPLSLVGTVRRRARQGRVRVYDNVAAREGENRVDGFFAARAIPVHGDGRKAGGRRTNRFSAVAVSATAAAAEPLQQSPCAPQPSPTRPQSPPTKLLPISSK